MKDSRGYLKPSQTIFNISYKRDGQQEFLPPIEAEARMKEILPQDLSGYFFFDGERIEKMSKEIQKGKSKEFAEAVRSLLGLNAFIAALEHLKPTSKFSVIGRYNEEYDSTSNSRIRTYTEEIKNAQQELNAIEERLAEINTQTPLAQEKCDELNWK